MSVDWRRGPPPDQRGSPVQSQPYEQLNELVAGDIGHYDSSTLTVEEVLTEFVCWSPGLCGTRPGTILLAVCFFCNFPKSCNGLSVSNFLLLKGLGMGRKKSVR